MFDDIVHQFLHNSEDKEFLFNFQSFSVIMKTGTGVQATTTADLLEQIGGCTFQSEILQCWWHKTMADIPDEQDSIVNDLLGAENALQLLGFFLVYQVFVEI